MLKHKKWYLPLLSILGVLLVSVAISSAVLSGMTAQAENVFSFAQNIRGVLSEPNWDSVPAKDMVPGKQVAKDPMITNTGTIDTYAGLQLSFMRTQGGTALSAAEVKRLLNLLDISWNPEWTLVEGSMEQDQHGDYTEVSPKLTFVYQNKLAPGEISGPIFSSVRVKTEQQGLTELDLRWLQGIKITDGEIVADSAGLGQFRVDIEGALAQASEFADYTQASDTLIQLLAQ